MALTKHFVAIKISNFACTSLEDVIHHEKLCILDRFDNF